MNDPHRDLWPAPHAATGPVRRRSSGCPARKSLTNRALVLAALADGPSVVRRALRSRDTALMAAALDRARRRASTPPATTGRSRPARSRGRATVDCGLAGTVMRFVPPVAALADGPVAFDGDPHARTRPMRRGAARRCAASASRSTTRAAARCRSPCRHRPRAAAARSTIDASASSQFVSALLLAGARFDEGVDVRHDGKPVPVAAAHRDDRRDAARARRRGRRRRAEPLAGRARAGPRGRRTDRAGPVQRRAVPGRGAGHRRPGHRARTGRARTTQAGDALREILDAMGGDGRRSTTTA